MLKAREEFGAKDLAAISSKALKELEAKDLVVISSGSLQELQQPLVNTISLRLHQMTRKPSGKFGKYSVRNKQSGRLEGDETWKSPLPPLKSLKGVKTRLGRSPKGYQRFNFLRDRQLRQQILRHQIPAIPASDPIPPPATTALAVPEPSTALLLSELAHRSVPTTLMAAAAKILVKESKSKKGKPLPREKEGGSPPPIPPPPIPPLKNCELIVDQILPPPLRQEQKLPIQHSAATRQQQPIQHSAATRQQQRMSELEEQRQAVLSLKSPRGFSGWDSQSQFLKQKRDEEDKLDREIHRCQEEHRIEEEQAQKEQEYQECCQRMAAISGTSDAGTNRRGEKSFR